MEKFSKLEKKLYSTRDLVLIGMVIIGFDCEPGSHKYEVLYKALLPYLSVPPLQHFNLSEDKCSEIITDE